MGKHTKGPWRAVKMASPIGHAEWEIAWSDIGELVADVVYHEADARLIAAARTAATACQWARRSAWDMVQGDMQRARSSARIWRVRAGDVGIGISSVVSCCGSSPGGRVVATLKGSQQFSAGTSSTDSIYHEAAVAYQRHMADEVWDAVNGVSA